MYKFDCLECNKPFEAKEKNRKFCQQSCASRYSGKKRFPKGLKNNISPKEMKYCLFCNKPLDHNKKIYCNNTCQHSKKRKERITQQLEGCSNHLLRKMLIENHGAKCMKCGWCEVHPITKAVPIELNHIDGNADNKNPPNLELLCPNCHSLTPNYRNLNKGKGRFKRMERYHQGKSW
jgi:hypothetical protein